MKEHGIRHFAITEGEQIIGVVSVPRWRPIYSDLAPEMQDLARLTNSNPETS
ncbi:hypothetical protein [Nitrospira sp. Nam74]